MSISIFLLCYNEELMLPHTLKHYRTRFPNASITIFDNYSTDRSATIAEEAGCRVIKYDSKEQQDEKLLIWIRSHLWKDYVDKGWVIMCDMDEWLDATEEDLKAEEAKGTTILTTQGINMVGESTLADYSDIDLFDIKKGYLDDNMSKRICFQYPAISMEFWYGAHKCFPQGRIQYSQKTYFLKHYDFLGAEYLVAKHKRRYERNEVSRMNGINQHYMNEREKSLQIYRTALSKAVVL